jgi:hypothetical protein
MKIKSRATRLGLRTGTGERFTDSSGTHYVSHSDTPASPWPLPRKTSIELSEHKALVLLTYVTSEQ